MDSNTDADTRSRVTNVEGEIIAIHRRLDSLGAGMAEILKQHTVVAVADAKWTSAAAEQAINAIQERLDDAVLANERLTESLNRLRALAKDVLDEDSSPNSIRALRKELYAQTAVL